MKIFISVDIEGTTAISSWREAIDDGLEYRIQCEIMTNEVLSAVKAINSMYEDAEIYIKDAHGSGRNIDIKKIPDNCYILRGWANNPLCMMEGFDKTFDAVMFIGYHSGAGSLKNPLAHTLNYKKYNNMYINGKSFSEFIMNYYIATYYNVPVIFMSGDKNICQESESYIPNIETVSTFEGISGLSISKGVQRVEKEIYNGVKKALHNILLYKENIVPLPDEYIVKLVYKNQQDAYRNSFYKGMEMVDNYKLLFKAEDYYDVLRMLMFV